jgi:hypothetical protein
VLEMYGSKTGDLRSHNLSPDMGDPSWPLPAPLWSRGAVSTNAQGGSLGVKAEIPVTVNKPGSILYKRVQ